MRAVNLLPSQHQTKRSLSERRLPLPGPLGDPFKVFPALLAGLVLGALVAGHVTQSGAVDDRRQTLEQLEAEVAERTKPVEVAEDPATAFAAPRLAAAKAVIDARVEWDEVLRQFALVLPTDVSITGLQAAAPGVAAAAGASADVAVAPTAFTLQGYTSSQPSVARLLTRLTQVPALVDVQLQSSTRADVDGRPVIQFTIGAGVRPAGGQ